MKDDNTLLSIQDMIRKEIDAIQNIPVDQSILHVIDIIHYHVHKLNAKVVTSGIGKAGHIAHNIAMTLSSTGTRSVFLHPTEAQHGDLGILADNDVLLVISNSGKTREVIELIKLSKRIYPYIKIIAITGNKESELADISNYVIWTGGGEEVGRFKSVPTTSTTLMTIIGDILVVQLMEAIDFTREHYGMLHHGGYIPEKLNNL